MTQLWTVEVIRGDHRNALNNPDHTAVGAPVRLEDMQEIAEHPGALNWRPLTYEPVTLTTITDSDHGLCINGGLRIMQRPRFSFENGGYIEARGFEEGADLALVPAVWSISPYAGESK